jgi:hypothetical protein
VLRRENLRMAGVILVPIWGQMGTSKFLSGRATQDRDGLFWGQRISGQENPTLLPGLGQRKNGDRWGSDRIPQKILIRGPEGRAIAGW